MKILLLASIIFWSCKTALASYTVDIYLDKITNPQHELINGLEHNFQICLDFANGTANNHNQCGIKGPFEPNLNIWTQTQVEQPWKGDLLVKVFMTDSHRNVFDQLSRSIKFNATSEAARYISNRRSFTVNIAVRCNLNWNGPQCDCNANSENIHFCFPNGTKECARDHYGENCEEYCMKSRTSTCSSDGTKRCHDNYYGENCDKHCMASNTTTCSSEGTKECRNDYYGENCDKYCQETSTYTCSSLGTKQCSNNHYGVNCDKYCSPTESYTCSSDGAKECRDNYYGENCDKHCKEEYAYSCSPEGNKVCRNDFYGENCNKYCKATDDHNGHYTCTQNGTKICNQDWYGENCDISCDDDSDTSDQTNGGTVQGTNSGKSGKIDLIPIIGGVSGAMVLLIVGLVAFFCIRKRRQSAQIDATPMQTMSNPVGHSNNTGPNDGTNDSECLYEEAVPVGSNYEDFFANFAPKKHEAGAAANTSNEIYAVPDKKNTAKKVMEPVDDVLIVENELYGSAV